MLFSKSKRRRKKNRANEYDEIIQDNRYEKLIAPLETKGKVLDLCEELVETAADFEDAKKEYDVITAYLNDMVIIDEMGQEDKKALIEASNKVVALNKTRDEFLKTEKKITDSQYALMQEFESDMPKIINRFKDNEKQLDTINRDLKYLEGVKAGWDFLQEDAKEEQAMLRKLSVMIMSLFAVVVILCLILRLFLDYNTMMVMLIGAFVAVLAGAYTFLRYQECTKNIDKANKNKNNAILLENRVKIRYVNAKSAVDYTIEKYHVRSSSELNYMYEKYLEAAKQREKFRRTSDDLESANLAMLNVLDKYRMYDSKIWLNHANAIVDKREMVELKHDLIVRRQKLRRRIEYSITAVTELKSQILLNREKVGDRVGQINDILRRVAELNMILEDEKAF